LIFLIASFPLSGDCTEAKERAFGFSLLINRSFLVLGAYTSPPRLFPFPPLQKTKKLRRVACLP